MDVRAIEAHAWKAVANGKWTIKKKKKWSATEVAPPLAYAYTMYLPMRRMDCVLVRANRGACDDLRAARCFEAGDLGLHVLRSSVDGESVDHCVADCAECRLEVALCEAALDGFDGGQVEAMPLQDWHRCAGGDEPDDRPDCALCLLCVLVDGEGGVGGDVELLLARGLLDDGHCEREVLRVGRVNQRAVADLAGGLEHLLALCADVYGDSLLLGLVSQLSACELEYLVLRGADCLAGPELPW